MSVEIAKCSKCGSQDLRGECPRGGEHYSVMRRPRIERLELRRLPIDNFEVTPQRADDVARCELLKRLDRKIFDELRSTVVGLGARSDVIPMMPTKVLAPSSRPLSTVEDYEWDMLLFRTPWSQS